MIEYILLAVGIFLLVKGADYLVKGSTSLAKRLRVPTLVIGLTIVAFGTTMPELTVNLFAAVKGLGEIAFGNIIGSNMANILLILGITAIITNVKIHKSTVWKEIPFSFLAVLILFVFSNAFLLDKVSINYLLRTEAIILLFFFVIFIWYVFGLAKRSRTQLEDKKIKIKERSYWTIFPIIILGIIALFIGGQWTVNSAATIARNFGVSEFLISASIVAIGTSLPELATAITAAKRKDTNLAVGNIMGSNILNIFWILGVTAVINPIAFPVFARVDLIILMATTFLLFLFMFIGKKHQLERWKGIVFVIAYILYIIFLIVRG